MLYGERLALAMQRRSDQTGQTVTRGDIARIAECSQQNVGMVIRNAKGTDQRFSAQAHMAVAAYLRVNPEWLATGNGPIEPVTAYGAPKDLSPAAIELAQLLDLIPTSNRLARAKAFNLASTHIIDVLNELQASDRPAQD